MAELNIGEHCKIETCKQLDLLPIVCNGCGRTFCKEHMSYESHGCPFLNSASVDHVTSAHSVPLSFACSLEKCSNREQTEVICDACGENFCLVHRHQSDHACTALKPREERMQKTAQRVQEILSKRTEPVVAIRKPLSEKSKSTAARVALMKLKQKAIGDHGIPDSERVFFSVILPAETRSQTKSLAMFFSERWSIGKVIDKLSDAAGLRNENNVSATNRLCLFNSVTGSICRSDRLIGELIREGTEHGAELYNGCTVILEYVAMETERLESLEPYTIVS